VAGAGTATFSRAEPALVPTQYLWLEEFPFSRLRNSQRGARPQSFREARCAGGLRSV